MSEPATPTRECTRCKVNYPETPDYFHLSKTHGWRSACRWCIRPILAPKPPGVPYPPAPPEAALPDEPSNVTYSEDFYIKQTRTESGSRVVEFLRNRPSEKRQNTKMRGYESPLARL